jgi:hypothetical protein
MRFCSVTAPCQIWVGYPGEGGALEAQLMTPVRSLGNPTRARVTCMPFCSVTAPSRIWARFPETTKAEHSPLINSAKSWVALSHRVRRVCFCSITTQLSDLNNLIPADSGWTLITAEGELTTTGRSLVAATSTAWSMLICLRRRTKHSFSSPSILTDRVFLMPLGVSYRSSSPLSLMEPLHVRCHPRPSH